MEAKIKPWPIILLMLAALLLPVSGMAKSRKPTAKKVPLYKVVVTCPKGMGLYVRQQSGFTSVGNGLFQMNYSWFTWDGESQLWDAGNATPTCFDKPPVGSETR